MPCPPTLPKISNNCNANCIPTDNVCYSGPNLPNSGINTHDIVTIVIEKLDAMYSVPSLQRVTDIGNYTTNTITANAFIKIGGNGTNLLLDNGDVFPISSIGGSQNLQQVTDIGNVTTTPIIANSFVKIGGDGTNILLDDGTVMPIPEVPGTVTSTSELINNGQDGIHPFITAQDIPDVIAGYGLQEITPNVIEINPLETQEKLTLTTIGTTGPSTLIDNTLNIPSLGYVPVNVAGDTMLGELILNADPIIPLEAATKQYVDRIQSGTYAHYVTMMSENKLLPERLYALTDYQHKYYIENTNTSPVVVYRKITFITTGYCVFDDTYVYDIVYGTILTIVSLPPNYTGTLTVGSTTLCTQNSQNFYFKFDNGMNNDGRNVGVGISYTYPRFATLTTLNGATVYDTHDKIEMQPGGVLNTNVHNGTVYGDMTAAENFTPPVEVLILKAKSTNSFYENCGSLTFINDEMIYDFNDNIVYNDNKEQIGTRNGFISRRFNTVLDIDIDKDWRAQRYRRWMVPAATVTSDYRKKLINIDYPNTNTYLAFQNKYLFTSELMNVNSVWNMYTCLTIETTSITAGIAGSVNTFPIVMDGGTGGLGSTGGIVKFIDYPIFNLDPTLNPIEVDKCIINNLTNTVFVNTNATNKSNLSVTSDRYFTNSTFLGYPIIGGTGNRFTNASIYDKITIEGNSNKFTNINILSYLGLSADDMTFKDVITGSLPYGVALTGMGGVNNNTPVKWLFLNGHSSIFTNCLIGVGATPLISVTDSSIVNGGFFHYGDVSSPNNSNEYLQISRNKLLDTNYHSYYSQHYKLDNTTLLAKNIKISQYIVDVVLNTDSNGVLYYQNSNILLAYNTVTKSYNYTSTLFETVIPNRVVSERSANYTLLDSDSGATIIFTASATLTIPTGLTDGFDCKFVTLAGVTLTVVSTGNILYNNLGSILAPTKSFILKRRITINTFISTGDL